MCIRDRYITKPNEPYFILKGGGSFDILFDNISIGGTLEVGMIVNHHRGEFKPLFLYSYYTEGGGAAAGPSGFIEAGIAENYNDISEAYNKGVLGESTDGGVSSVSTSRSADGNLHTLTWSFGSRSFNAGNIRKVTTRSMIVDKKKYEGISPYCNYSR